MSLGIQWQLESKDKVEEISYMGIFKIFEFKSSFLISLFSGIFLELNKVKM